MTPCTICGGTGWKPVDKAVTRCDCRQRKIASDMAVLATEPTGKDAEDLKRLAFYLSRECRGRQNAKTWRDIALAVFSLGQSDGDRRIRALARGLVKLGHPIATGNFGYFYATSPEDLDGPIKRQKAQAMKTLERISRLEAIRGQLDREVNGAVYDA